MLACVCTCHDVTVVNGERIGDPLDLKMFEATKWEVTLGRAHPAHICTGTGPTPPTSPPGLRDMTGAEDRRRRHCGRS